MPSRIEKRQIKAYRKDLREAPEELRENIVAALKETVTAVHARGKANIQSTFKRRTGALLRNYKRTVRKKSLTALVGYITKAGRRDAFYARFLHDGTRSMPARPFHGNAVEAEKEADTRRHIEARDKVLRDLSGKGPR